MFLLDTNIVSQATKKRPNAAVVAWLIGVRNADLYISAITIQEISFGIQLLDAGKKRQRVQAWLDQELRVEFKDRILAVDAGVAETCGSLLARAKRNKHMVDLADGLIAATAHVHQLTLATLNRRDFGPLDVSLVEF